MRQIKNLKFLLLAAVAMLALTACGSKKKEISVDVQKLAEDLNAQTVTSDTLAPSQSAMISRIYLLDESTIETAAAYLSGGATASEIAVFACKEEKQTADVKAKLENRISSQKDLYASYAPEQVTKLDAAIIKTAGKYVALAVCDDTAKAETLLKDAGF